MKEAGGIWEDLAYRRAAAGAVGGGLDVGDESLIVIGVIEKTGEISWEILGGCAEFL